MVDFSLCRECTHGKLDLPKYDKDGQMVVLASVLCDVEDGLLLMNSEVPGDCIYLLEQVLTIQDMDIDIADRLSGDGELQETC